MSKSTEALYTQILPVGHQVDRLKLDTGLDRYHIRGTLTPRTLPVVYPSGERVMTLVWTFRYQDVIEDVVREHMLHDWARSNQISEADARRYLTEHLSALPMRQCHIRLLYQPEPPPASPPATPQA